jgi:hypothetical protein
MVKAKKTKTIKLGRTVVENPRIEFPVDLHCYGCGESARYQFSIEESRDEYLTLWHNWHSVETKCDSDYHEGYGDDCARCGGTNIILVPKPNHKRIQLPWPPKRSRKQNRDAQVAPLLCDPPRLGWKRTA